MCEWTFEVLDNTILLIILLELGYTFTTELRTFDTATNTITNDT